MENDFIIAIAATNKHQQALIEHIGVSYDFIYTLVPSGTKITQLTFVVNSADVYKQFQNIQTNANALQYKPILFFNNETKNIKMFRQNSD